jgi:hypothetical protein
MLHYAAGHHAPRLSVIDLLSEVDHHETIDYSQQCMYDVLNPDDRHPAFPDSGNFFNQGTTFLLSQATSDLVQEQNSRIRAESSCQLQSLAIEECQAAGSDVCLGQETSFFQDLSAAMVYHAFGLSISKNRANQDILEN